MNKNSRGGNYLAPLCLALVVAAMGAAEMAADEPGQTSNFVFRDATESAGLMPQVGQIQGHAAGWGDIDGDGHIDLYVATFAREEGKRNLLFRNQGGRFTWDEQSEPQIATRATGAVLADLDNDGDLDLYVSSMPQPKSGALGCSLFHNDGTGQFANISHGNGACPTEFGGRSAAVLDFDGDGLLDLLVGEDPLPGYNGSKTKSSRLFRNLGGLAFEDASAAAGLPAETPGLGVAAADINNDGWPDLFLASHAGGNVLLLNDGSGRFKEAAGCRETFAWPEAGGDNMVCGVCFGDINRDGLLDVALGPHFKAPWQEPVAIRLYINRGVTAGQPRFEEIGQQAGLLPLAMKTPHVELQDYD
ncbi:MAG: FG-GAP repeat domain-containing protein, partial [Pirellulales bacterium]